jgi:hypothetical protein
MEITTVKAVNWMGTYGRRAIETVLLWGFMLILALYGPYMLVFNQERMQSGWTWGLSAHFGPRVIGFEQHLWVLAYILMTIFFWWGVYHIYQLRDKFLTDI